MGAEEDTISHLDQARSLALGQPSLYPQILPTVLSLIGPAQPTSLRRWGAEFLAETFASSVIGAKEKQKMSLDVLSMLTSYLKRKEEVGEHEDPSVIKASVQCAASIYPLVFRHTLEDEERGPEVWKQMSKIKGEILMSMDTAFAGVRICCIRFVACVVLVQTAGVITDPRRPAANEVSLALVPRDHAVITPSMLEAETSALLDRLMGVLQDNTSDALIATATLNALSSLVKKRPSISVKILATVLCFNPLKLARPGISGRDKVSMKSMTRTTICFLVNFMKLNTNHSMVGRMHQHVDRLRCSLADVLAGGVKRMANGQPDDSSNESKRAKLDGRLESGTTNSEQSSQAPRPPSLPSGPVTLAQLFTLNQDAQATAFNVQLIPQTIVAQLVPALLSAVDRARIDAALDVVRARWLEIQQRPPPSLDVEEDDDYDPLTGFGDHDQANDHAEQLSQEAVLPDVAIGSFSLPPSPPLSEQAMAEHSEIAEQRLFKELDLLDEQARQTKLKKPDAERTGFNRLAALSHDRDGWVTILTRLITRPTFDLVDKDDDDLVKIKEENADRMLVKKTQAIALPSRIRQAFHKFIMDDWRRRIDVAIAWLNEEWYAEKVRARMRSVCAATPEEEVPTYFHHAIKLLDSMVAYIDIKDARYLIRFLSEIPALSPTLLARIKTIALDPERVNVAVQALMYLCLLRLPAREMALDVAESMWKENEDARAAVEKSVLKKWRPQALEAVKEQDQDAKTEA